MQILAFLLRLPISTPPPPPMGRRYDLRVSRWAAVAKAAAVADLRLEETMAEKPKVVGMLNSRAGSYGVYTKFPWFETMRKCIIRVAVQ